MPSLAPRLTPSLVSGKRFEHPSGNIRLQPVKGEHSQQLFEAIDRNREHLEPWLPWVPYQQGPADSLAFLLPLDFQPFGGTGVAFGLWHDDIIIGTLGLHGQEDVPHGSELGYWIDSTYQKQGLITWAGRTLLEDLSQYRQATHFWMRIVPENAPSQAVARRLRFTHVDTLHNIEYRGHHYPELQIWKRYMHPSPGAFASDSGRVAK